MSFWTLLQTNFPLLLVTVFLLGLTVGSFLNVVIYRLPKMLEREWQTQAREILHPDEEATAEEPFDLLRPASRCGSCGHKIRPWENIPLVSYLLLGGKCSACGAAIGLRYPIVELVTGLLSVAVAWHFGWGWPLLAGLILTWTLIPLTLIDFDHQLLPDSITLPVLWLGLVASLIPVFVSPEDALLGAAFGYLSLWSVYQLFRLLTGKEGMGFGDFKLLALLGAWLGWQQLPVIILLSSLVGAVVGVALILFRGRDRNIPIPFGPYLAAAGWLAMLWGQDISEAYLQYSGF